jgi:CysZ protein
MLGRGFATWAHAPGAMVLGWVPALIVALAFAAGILALGLNLEHIAEAITPFASAWEEPLRTGMRVVAGLAFLAASVLAVVLTFTTVTLVVGGWFYERIWAAVEGRFGSVPNRRLGFWRGAAVDIGEGIRMLIPAILTGLVLFGVSLIPVAGQLLAIVLGALLGGRLLTLELTALAFTERGMSLRERRAALRGRRALTLGFGAATYLLFLIPLGAVIVMPAAVAGATLLSRRVLALPYGSAGDRIEP